MSYPQDAYQLGMPTQIYKTSRQVIIHRIINGVVALLAAVIGVVLAITLHPILLILSAMCLGYAVFTGLRLRRNLGTTMLMAEKGLVQLQNDQVEAIEWDDIAEIWVRAGFGYKLIYDYQVRSRDGRRVYFSTPADVDFGDMVQHEFARRLSDAFIDAFANGETLVFGKFTVNNFGLFAGHQQVNWRVLQDVKVEGRRILAYYNGKWRQLAWISEIPNVALFVSTLKFILTMDL